MDIAQLGIEVDSEELRSGSTELKTFGDAAKDAEGSVNSLEGATKSQSAAQRAANEVQKTYNSGIQSMESRLKRLISVRNSDTNALKRSKTQLSKINKDLAKDLSTIQATQALFINKDIEQTEALIATSDLKIDALQKEIIAQKALADAEQDGIDIKEAANEVTKVGVDLSLASIVKLASAVGLVEFAASAAVSFIASLIPEVVLFDDAIDELERSVRASAKAAELSQKDFTELQEIYGGNEVAVRNYIAALSDLRIAEKFEELDNTLGALRNNDGIKSLESLLGRTGNASANLDAVNIVLENSRRTLGLTGLEAKEFLNRLTDLEKSKSFEEAAEKAADFRQWLVTTDSTLSDDLLPTLLELEGVARTSFAEASKDAEDFDKVVNKAAKSLASIQQVTERANRGASAARGDKKAVIEAELKAEIEALGELAREAVKSGANKIEIAKSTYNATVALQREATAEIAKIDADNDKKRMQAFEAEKTAKIKAIEAISAKTEKSIASQLKGSGNQLELIQRRLNAEYDALDELAARAIANGADAVEINNMIAEAKRQALFSANTDIFNHEEKLRDKAAKAEKRQRDIDTRDAKRRAEEEARTKDRIKNFDRALNRDGIKPGGNLDNNQFGGTAKKFGTSRQLGRQSPQSQLSDILSQEQEMIAELDALEAERMDQVGSNREAQLEIEQDFADRRAAIQEEMLERQKDVMAQAADLALGDAENLFGSLADAAATAFGKQSAAARAFLVAEQGIMIARASMALGPALMNALAAPFPVNLAQFATVAALGAQIIGNISNISTAIQGREQGGFTSKNMIYEVNERGLPEVYESGGKRYLMPGSDGNVVPESRLPRAGGGNAGSGGVVINMIDRAGVKLTQRQMSDGEIELLVEERVNSGIDKKVPKLVSGQLNRPNSKISQAMGQSIKAPRNRP